MLQYSNIIPNLMSEEANTYRLRRTGPEFQEPPVAAVQENLEPQEPVRGTLVWSLIDRVTSGFQSTAAVNAQIYTGPHQFLDDTTERARSAVSARVQAVGKIAAFRSLFISSTSQTQHSETAVDNPYDQLHEQDKKRYAERLLIENFHFDQQAEKASRKSMRMVSILPAIALLAGDESTYRHLVALSHNFRDELTGMDAGELGVAQLARGTVHDDAGMVEAGAINLMQGMHQRHDRQRFELLFSGYAISGHETILEQAIQSMGPDYYLGMRMLDHVLDIGGDAEEVHERVDSIEAQIEALSAQSGDVWAPVAFKVKKLEAVSALRDRSDGAHDPASPRAELYGYDIQTLGQELMNALKGLDNQAAPLLAGEEIEGDPTEIVAKYRTMLPYVARVLTTAYGMDGAPGLIDNFTKNLAKLNTVYEPDNNHMLRSAVEVAEMGMEGLSAAARDMIDKYDIHDRNLGFDSFRYRVYRALLYEGSYFDDQGNLTANARFDDIPSKTQNHAAFMALLHTIVSSPDAEQSRFDVRSMLSPASEQFELLEYIDRRRIFFRDVVPEATNLHRFGWLYPHRGSIDALSQSLGKDIDYAKATAHIGEGHGSLRTEDQWVAYLGLLHAPTLGDKIEYLSRFPTNTLYQPEARAGLLPPASLLWWPRQRAGTRKPKPSTHI